MLPFNLSPSPLPRPKLSVGFLRKLERDASIQVLCCTEDLLCFAPHDGVLCLEAMLSLWIL